MSTIIVSHIPNSVTTEKLENFFGFCGQVVSITSIPDQSQVSKSYEIHFESPKALSTALLLNEAELDGVPIEVQEKPLDTKAAAPPAYTHAESHDKDDDNTTNSAAKGETGDYKVQHATKTGDVNYDDISQEEKPKYAIMAQLLANGYIISDNVIQSAIKIDEKNGYSTKFKNFISSLDEKYLHSQTPGTTANKNLTTAQDTFTSAQNTLASYSKTLAHYFEKASTTPYGIKIHEFYQNFAKDVQDVHKEATRLVELKKSHTQET
jgi:hypothetical protein